MVILLLMYESGCRVQGMIDLKENDYTNVVDCMKKRIKWGWC